MDFVVRGFGTIGEDGSRGVGEGKERIGSSEVARD
jgi:hypothetical protein